MLMPDRFAQGKGHPSQIKGLNAYREDRTQPSLRHGGDLNGIMEHLDYFNQLGVTALWFTPVLENKDRKSTRLNSSHANISYAVFCLKKKKPLQYRCACPTSF